MYADIPTLASKRAYKNSITLKTAYENQKIGVYSWC